MPFRTHAVRQALLLIVACLAHAASSSAQGLIQGRIIEADTGDPLIGANIVVLGTSMGAAADANGQFEIQGVPEGSYTLRASMVSFESARADVEVEDGKVAEVSFVLELTAVSLREVVVTPGRFTVMQAEPTVAQTLSREEIQSLPQLGEDIYRAVSRLPGLSNNDYSSAFTIRGGSNREVLVQLDGLELYEPFHLKDIGGGALSILDVEAIGGIDMMTGAFPVEYGDRMSGVFNISSHTPVEGRTRTSMGLSFTNFRFLTEGRFADGKGEWLVLGRRGYLDIVLELIDDGSGFTPTYYDIFGKSKYRFNERHVLSFNVLQAGDDLTLTEDDGFTADTRYVSTYGWLNWGAIWTPRLHAQTVASAGRLSWKRDGGDVFQELDMLDFSVQDDRDFDYVGLKQDWTYDLTENQLLKAGFDLKRLSAGYDYANLYSVSTELVDGEIVVDYDTTSVALRPSGTEFGAYVSHRIRPWRPLTLEWGLRYDAISWSDDVLLSPRINLALAIGARTALRLGWGHFHQAQGINELDVQDGENQFYPAELAEHRVVGLEHAFPNIMNVRLEAYQKKLSDLRPRYINLFPDNTDFFPEVYNDRRRFEATSGESYGLELLLRDNVKTKVDWTASYGFAVVEDEIDGREVPRNFDQRHTIYLDMSYQPSSKWRMHLSWQYHSGWPFTDVFFEKVDQPDGTFFIRTTVGELNGARFPAFHRMDVRVSRYFALKRSRLAAFLEISNVYNRANPRVYFYNLDLSNSGTLIVNRGQDEWLPRLPSIGISWDIYR